MKYKITEKQIKLIEALNLNLGKELTKYQNKQPITQELDKIFGKGVYRLYYDLRSGKQIFPTIKSIKTNLKFDLTFTNKLKSNIEQLLKSKNYELVDFNKNIAKNIQNNQQIKITKILNELDNDYLKNYNLYLDSISKGLTENQNIYVVISRHAYDIGGMSTDREWSSCEDLGQITNIKQMGNFRNGEESEYDGDGVRVGDMIRSGSLIFYSIKEGDWNIKHPLSRFSHGVYCTGEAGTQYGKTVAGFTDFIREWVLKWETEFFGKYNNSNNVDTSIQTLKLPELDNYYYAKQYERFVTKPEFFRLLFKYKREDFFNSHLNKKNYSLYDIELLATLTSYFGKTFLEYFTPELKNTVLRVLGSYLDNVKTVQYNFLNRENVLYPNLKKFVDNLKKHNGLENMNLTSVATSTVLPQSYYDEINGISSYKNFFYTFFGKSVIDNILNINQQYFNGKREEIRNLYNTEFQEFMNKQENNKQQLQAVNETKNMKTLKLTEAQIALYFKKYITEGIYDDENKEGAIELNKTTNPNDIKKFTTQGLDVKLVDEEFGEEQPLTLKHKFEVSPSGVALNIYASKDKIKLSEVLDYILTIKDQLKVQQALAANDVTLFIKQAASGRYMHMGKITPKTYNSYLGMLKNKKTSDFAQKTELNENIIKFLKK